jgi:hypothetical protein
MAAEMELSVRIRTGEGFAIVLERVGEFLSGLPGQHMSIALDTGEMALEMPDCTGFLESLREVRMTR